MTDQNDQKPTSHAERPVGTAAYHPARKFDTAPTFVINPTVSQALPDWNISDEGGTVTLKAHHDTVMFERPAAAARGFSELSEYLASANHEMPPKVVLDLGNAHSGASSLHTHLRELVSAGQVSAIEVVGGSAELRQQLNQVLESAQANGGIGGWGARGRQTSKDGGRY